MHVLIGIPRRPSKVGQTKVWGPFDSATDAVDAIYDHKGVRPELLDYTIVVRAVEPSFLAHPAVDEIPHLQLVDIGLPTFEKSDKQGART